MDVHDIRTIIRRILFTVTALSVIVGTGIAYGELELRAHRLGDQYARALMVAVDRLDAYTASAIDPLLDQLPPGAFHAESQPSFAAQQVFRTSAGHGQGFEYRTPMLNPTAPSDRASPFEVQLINEFTEHRDLTELTGLTDTPHERLYYLARPIRVGSAACLRCHGTPADAPPAMLAKYGSANGFGWKLGEVVGIQILTVPVTTQFSAVLWLIVLAAGCVLLAFAICYVTLATSLNTSVIRPLQALAAAAESASIAAGKSVQVAPAAATELRQLAAAIERLRVSLAKTMARLSEVEQRQAAVDERADTETRT